jgi:hypothetical protein
MSEARELHAKRLREALEKIPELGATRNGVRDPKFRAWKDRTRQTLSSLYGEKHDYTRRFEFLTFQELRMRYQDEPEWDEDDQRRFESDLEMAQEILSDAVEEFPIAAPPVAEAARAPRAGGPSITVNIHNVLSQTVSVEVSQIVAELESVELPEEKRNEAKALAKDLHAEVRGQKRWDVMGKSIAALKALGRPVFEKVVVPILLEWMKREAGL